MDVYVCLCIRVYAWVLRVRMVPGSGTILDRVGCLYMCLCMFLCTCMYVLCVCMAVYRNDIREGGCLYMCMYVCVYMYVCSLCVDGERY